MRRKVVKVNNLYQNGWGFYLGMVTQNEESNLLGNVTLSLPFKKGRRKLVKGYVTAEPYSSQYFDGLRYELYFHPSTVVQSDKLFRLLGVN